MDRIVTIAGRRWRIVFDRVPSDANGICDAPNATGKRITLRPSLRRNPALLMETIIHEVLHASGWPLSEEWVTQAAEDIARILWAEGFRLQKD